MRRVDKPGHPRSELLGVPDPTDPPGPAAVPLATADAQLRQALDGITDPAQRKRVAVDRFANRLDAATARQVLLKEQRALCAFCEGRVTAAPHHASPQAETNMRIAHWQPRVHHPERALDWQNLFGSCDTQHRRDAVRHCDDAQGSDAPPAEAPTPAQADYSAWLKLSADGKLLSLPTAPPFVEEVINLFRLNAKPLCHARSEVVRGLHDAMPPRGSQRRRAALELSLASLSRPGNLPPYVTAMRWWLQKQIDAAAR